MQENISGARAQRFSDTDLPGALRDRHQHNIHDADAADHQRNRGNGADRQGQGAQHLIHQRALTFRRLVGIKAFLLILDSAQVAGDFIGHLRNVFVRIHIDLQHRDAITGICLQQRIRHIAVVIAAAHLAENRGFHIINAQHGQVPLLPVEGERQDFAHGVFCIEELHRRPLFNDNAGTAAFHVGLIDHPPV